MKKQKAKAAADGEAIGPLQIHYVYWVDAVTFQTNLLTTNGYAACEDWEYSKQIVKACLTHYVPEAVATTNLEVLARTHNGGPHGAEKDSTLPFWRKFQDNLK
jgi:hypothetical protein